MYDILIKNGTIVDGTGGPRYLGDLAVTAGKIVKIAEKIDGEAKTVLDAGGKIVSPGFIDSHSHADMVFLLGTSGYNYLEQGTTTEICGPCGESPMPYFDGFYKAYEGMFPEDKMAGMIEILKSTTGFMSHAKTLALGTNMGFLVGQGTVRGRVMGYSMDTPSDAQMDEMRGYVQEAMDCGFLGISSGLIYPPSIYASEDEITELVKVAAKNGGIYSTHIRGEDERCPEAVEEAIRVAEACGIPLVVSHFKIVGKDNEGLSRATIGLVSDALKRGMKVRVDQYPFLAGGAGLVDSIPPWHRENGIDALVEKLKDSAFRRRVTDELQGDEGGFENFYKSSGFEGFLILMSPAAPDLIGKTVAQVARERGSDQFDTFYDLLIESHGAMFIGYVSQNESDMLRILQYPYTMPGSDLLHNLAETDPETVGGWHPRATATMPRHLSLIRDNGLMSLEAAVHRMTGMPADFYSLRGRGVLREGAWADICVFDYAKVEGRADYIHPYRRNEGIDTVIVNGQVAVSQGRYNGARAGAVLTRE